MPGVSFMPFRILWELLKVFQLLKENHRLIGLDAI